MNGSRCRRSVPAILVGLRSACILLTALLIAGAAGGRAFGLSVTRAAAGQPGLYWIYWAPRWEGEATRAAEMGERIVSPRAEARLRKVGADLSPSNPVNRPVPRAFLAHLRDLGVQVRVASRFLRAASADLDAATLARLASDLEIVALVPVVTLHGPGPEAGLSDEQKRYSGAPLPWWGRPGAVDGLRPADDQLRGQVPGDTLPDPRTLTQEAYGPSWDQCDQLGVTGLHRLGYSGRGVLVCILDGGFYPGHDAFARANVIATWDFAEHDASVGYDPGRVAPYNTPAMEYHGTYTFSTLGGFTAGRLIGPAYRAEFALGRTEIVETETRAEEDNYVAGLQWADSLGTDVVSTSLGYLNFDDGFTYWPEELDGRHAVTSRAAAALVRRGVVLVTAIGNEGPSPGSLITPADAESVISVGAVDAAGDVTNFSSRGPNALGVIKPDVCARGQSTVCANASAHDAYTAVNGTSLSTPLMGGLVALLIEAHRDWTPWQIQHALHAAGDHAQHPDNAYGWGVPDGLLALGDNAPPGPTSAELTLRSATWIEEDVPGQPTLRDSVASPGELGRFRLILANTGDVAASAAWLQPFAPPEGITTGADSVRIPEIAPGASITIETAASILIAENHPVPTQDRLPLRFRTDRGTVYYRTLALAVLPPRWQVRPYPNPLLASGELTMDLEQPEAGPVSVTVFDASGRVVARPFTREPVAALARLHWTPASSLPSGTYYLRIETRRDVRSQRFLLLR